ncbi:hypothetical protein [Streptomyces sp. NPDC059176]|uniref:hypothetical protein n=1 Tax=unclassified Streptomyces TaxID=2593676 RepID=UPI00367637C2
MKPMKAAAIVAGSLAVVGAAAPAFAAAPSPTPHSVTGAMETVADRTTGAAQPLANRTLDTEQDGALLNSAQGAANNLNKAKDTGTGKLLGGLPVGAS